MVLQNLLLPLFYFILWIALSKLLALWNNKYLQSAKQQNNFITVIHALLIPVLTIAYFLTFKNPIAYDLTVQKPLIHLLAGSISFLIFSTIKLRKLEPNIGLIYYLHHLLTAAFFTIVILFPSHFINYFGWLLAWQMNGVIYHTYLIFKEHPNSSKQRIANWYNANFYAWILFRFILEGAHIALGLYFEFTQFKMELIPRIIVVFGILTSYYFNLSWLFILVKNRRKKLAEILAD